jgi:hypothetical protein
VRIVRPTDEHAESAKPKNNAAAQAKAKLVYMKLSPYKIIPDEGQCVTHQYQNEH